jgi:hypothetical protein
MDSFEKRQRERRKLEKRKEKEARKKERAEISKRQRSTSDTVETNGEAPAASAGKGLATPPESAP